MTTDTSAQSDVDAISQLRVCVIERHRSVVGSLLKYIYIYIYPHITHNFYTTQLARSSINSYIWWSPDIWLFVCPWNSISQYQHPFVHGIQLANINIRETINE